MAKVNTDEAKIKEILSRGVKEVIEKDHLERRLLSGERLRIKFGVDPTGSVLHLGHSLPLRKLQQFLDLGHEVILLIGDLTATIGDPSGRLEERPPLSREEIKANMKNYLKQAAKVLNIKKAEIRYNSEWYDKKNAKFFMELASKFTYTRLMDRAEFKERIKSGGDVTLLELTYPLLQGYDSFQLRADVEIGGTDQKFNLLTGRKVQRRYGMPEQDVITIPLLVGIDGEKKMSKTYNNFIALMDSKEDIFAKIMTVPDSLIWSYFYLLTDLSLDEIEEKKKKASEHILEIKKELAQEVTKQLYGLEKAKQAKEGFERVFSQHQLPEDIKEIPWKGDLMSTSIAAGIVGSKAEIKRLIEQKAVKINGRVVEDWNESVAIPKEGILLKIGPRRFYRVKN